MNKKLPLFLSGIVLCCLFFMLSSCAEITSSDELADKAAAGEKVTGDSAEHANITTEIIEGGANQAESVDTKQPEVQDGGKSEAGAEAEKVAQEAKANRIAEEKEAKRIAAKEEAAKRMAEEEKKRIAAKEAKIYDVEIKPLTVKDCLGCHISQRRRIHDNGGKHSLVLCTACHRSYHAYNPLHDNYSAIMPSCSWCHDTPHGNERTVLKCLRCHTDPHQPIASIPDPAELESDCRTCHLDIAAILQDKPSKHTDLKCSSCHSQKHGRIPDCSECHKNHSPLLTLETSDCMACHPVHSPKEISYPQSQSKELCSGCHTKPYQDLKEKQTKHSTFTCAKCHPKHGRLMACQDCHGYSVHDPRIHQQHQDCGECHSIAHRLDK